MMERDDQRLEAIQAAMRLTGFDALVAALPMNVLLLTGYWPVVGQSIAIVNAKGDVGLVVPEDEQSLANSAWAEVRTFRPAGLADLQTAAAVMTGPLRELCGELLPCTGRVGYEVGGTTEPSSYAAMYLFGCLVPALLEKCAPQLDYDAADATFATLRSVKTLKELGHIRTACRIVEGAFHVGVEQLEVGLTERQAAVHFHGPLFAGWGDSSPERMGGFSYCMSGPNSAQAYGAYARSWQRRLQPNDLVLVHCNSYADGFWTDVTRTYCLGDPDRQVQSIYEAIFAARDAALKAIRPGVRAADVDHAARAVLTDRGFGSAFKHPTGHGVGFGAISPEDRPRLHPKSDDILQPGMVMNVEPAVYLDGFGGARHCDMVVMTDDRTEVLTPFQDSLETLPREASARVASLSGRHAT